MRALAWLRVYVAHPDAKVAAANGVALLVASNQPFYPLYVWYVAGGGPALVSLLTWFSTPFFALVPVVGRRHPAAGRALLVGAGVINTMVCAKAFGVQSAVELFLLPCALLAVLAFYRHEYALSLGLIGVAVAAFALLRARLGAPLIAPEAALALVNLHAFSVAALSLYILWAFLGPAARARQTK